ncbi:MAG: GAF domain-containing sensor histidine kinase [Candidatus Brocadiaceae bacterium]
MDEASDGINGGQNGGRLCWAVGGTLSGSEVLAQCARQTNCLDCDFLHLARSEEGRSFQLLKLARGVSDHEQLQHTIANVESLMAIHERLRSHFDLNETVKEITEEARKVTGAQRSLVLFLKGDRPALHGQFTLKGKPQKVVIELDENSAVGFAALNNQMVNLRDIYQKPPPPGVPAFNRDYDEKCRCKTHSFLAVPVNDPGGRVIGVITAVNARKGYFSSDDEWFMGQYATEVALAAEKQKFIQQSVSALRLASIGETVAGLSHCIKNIAQALRAGSYVIKKAIGSGDLQQVNVAWEILDRHIERLADLSMDVLAHDPEVRRRSKGGGLNGLVEHVVDLFREEARARAIDIRFDPGEDVPAARFDAMGVYRCTVNLISNALDACPLSDGVVTVSTGRTGEAELMLSVADNGQGMDAETKEAVFELFQTTKADKGVGLGLPTVAEIVRKHNGRIEIETAAGEGTIFRVFIPEDVAVA